jgi:hypothetical protein
MSAAPGIGGGIINEVYYPRVDIPQIRDLGFLIGDGAGFWVEVSEQDTLANPLGLHVVEINVQRLRAGRRIDLTYRAGTQWVGRDFCVQVVRRTPQSG